MSETSNHKLNPPDRILLGPGPSNIAPRVQASMLAPLVGHLDPYFVTLMVETEKLLRSVFQTQNELTFPISGTGSAGMEASLINFLEPNDVALIGINGYFGERLAEIADKIGVKVVRVEAEWGKIIEPEAIENALKAEKNVKLVALIHAETSTGVMQPIPEIAKLASQHDALLLVDTVASLGGQEVAVDEWGVDICYSGSQKCISCPPGLSPFTANDKARKVLSSRETQMPAWYLDISLLSKYWTAESKAYHHTAPISMIYAFYESLVAIIEEGLEARVQRHLTNGQALQSGLEAMGLKLHAQEGFRLSSLTTVHIPDGVDDARIRQRLLNEYNIEIGGGLGPLKGQVWRIGLMGYSSSAKNVLLILSVLEKLLSDEGYSVEQGAGVAAATRVFSGK